MRSNPKLDNMFIFHNADGAIIQVDSYRIDWFCVINAFKMQTGVRPIFDKKLIGFFTLRLNIFWQKYKEFSKFCCGAGNHNV